MLWSERFRHLQTRKKLECFDVREIHCFFWTGNAYFFTTYSLPGKSPTPTPTPPHPHPTWSACSLITVFLNTFFQHFLNLFTSMWKINRNVIFGITWKSNKTQTKQSSIYAGIQTILLPFVNRTTWLTLQKGTSHEPVSDSLSYSSAASVLLAWFNPLCVTNQPVAENWLALMIKLLISQLLKIDWHWWLAYQSISCWKLIGTGDSTPISQLLQIDWHW